LGHEGMVRQGGRPKNQAWRVMKVWSGRQARWSGRWSGKAGHEGMVRQGGRLLGQASKVVRLIGS